MTGVRSVLLARICYHVAEGEHCDFIDCPNFEGTSQERFEAGFPLGYHPKIDVRTPSDVAAQAEREGWT